MASWKKGRACWAGHSPSSRCPRQCLPPARTSGAFRTGQSVSGQDEAAGMRAGRVSQSPGEAQGCTGGGVWELLEALTVLLFRVSDPAQVSWSKGSQVGGLLAESPSLPPTGQGSLCARVLGALLSGMPVGITVRAPRYLPASRPQTSSPPRDMIIGPVTPLHAVLPQPRSPSGSLHAHGGSCSTTHVDGGERRGKQRPS